MAVIYLALNAVMYLGLGLWCTIAPDTTSRAIGFAFTKPAARSEYLTVYGGLELGLGIFFAVCAWHSPLRDAGLVLALITYGCLALYRIGTLIFLSDLGRFPLAMLAIELPMVLAAAWLYFGSR